VSASIDGVRPVEERIVVAGCATHVLRGGDGPPLVYLHGARGGGVWHPFMERLARRFEVIAPEHPGFGRSDTPDWFDNIHDVAYFYLSLMRELGLRDAHLVGSSLGGWIAAEVAVRSTERLASLALIGSAGIQVKGVPRPDTFLWTEEEAARNLFHDPALAERALAGEPDEAEVERRLKNRFAVARLAWAPRFFDPHLSKWLHRIDVPTLVLWGREDRLIPPAHAERFAALIPGARLELFENCGHLPQIERAEAFCRMFEEFAGRRAP
jgi:pimeloyl-ACP methyl ester carboxylesterase